MQTQLVSFTFSNKNNGNKVEFNAYFDSSNSSYTQYGSFGECIYFKVYDNYKEFTKAVEKYVDNTTSIVEKIEINKQVLAFGEGDIFSGAVAKAVLEKAQA